MAVITWELPGTTGDHGWWSWGQGLGTGTGHNTGPIVGYGCVGSKGCWGRVRLVEAANNGLAGGQRVSDAVREGYTAV